MAVGRSNLQNNSERCRSGRIYPHVLDYSFAKAAARDLQLVHPRREFGEDEPANRVGVDVPLAVSRIQIYVRVRDRTPTRVDDLTAEALEGRVCRGTYRRQHQY